MAYYRFEFISFCLFISLITFSLKFIQTHQIPAYSGQCKLRKFAYNRTVVDENGKRCSGLVMTKACYGYCESYEFPTHEFPYAISVNPTCNYGSMKEVVTKLSMCDAGIRENLKFYKHVEATSCTCTECNRRTQNCITLLAKRNVQDNIDFTYERK